MPLGQGHTFFIAEAVGLEPTSESCSPPVFKTGPSSGRMTSVRSIRTTRSVSSAAAAGIEPASRRLTAACPYQHRPHRNQRFNLEAPANSRWRLASEKSTQRESNPHFRPGKAARCRYIMGAFFRSWSNCQTSPHGLVVRANSNATAIGAVPTNAEHRVGLEPTFPHYGCGVLAAERPVLVVAELVVILPVGPEGLEPSPTWLRARHAAANTLIPRLHSSGAGGI